MLPIVFEYRGTLDKLIGDAVMAFFGAPLPLPDHAAMAAATALRMRDRLAHIRETHEFPGAEKLFVGIGINTGEVTVGNLGSTVFVDYTVIGDVVNLASRLEGLNKIYGTSILVTEATRNAVADRFLLRELDRVAVKGKKQAVRIFELLGEKEGFPAAGAEAIGRFEAGVAAYRTQEWNTARSCFTEVIGLLPNDAPSQLYLERIERFEGSAPAADWDGTTVFGKKY